MTIKSQSDYRCPHCQREWLPYAAGLACPFCKNVVRDSDVTRIIEEALESARFNKRLYGKFDVDYWIVRSLGDKYLQWGFKALQAAEADPNAEPHALAIGATMQLDLEELSTAREHVAGFLETLIARFRAAKQANPADWEKMPEPDKPFLGRKIIDDQL
jgi:hypothetical protein